MKRPKINYVDGIANCTSFDVKKLEKYIDHIESKSQDSDSLLDRNEIDKAVRNLAKESTAPDKETPNWMEADIRRGMGWMYKRLTGSEYKYTNK